MRGQGTNQVISGPMRGIETALRLLTLHLWYFGEWLAIISNWERKWDYSYHAKRLWLALISNGECKWDYSYHVNRYDAGNYMVTETGLPCLTHNTRSAHRRHRWQYYADQTHYKMRYREQDMATCHSTVIHPCEVGHVSQQCNGHTPFKRSPHSQTAPIWHLYIFIIS